MPVKGTSRARRGRELLAAMRQIAATGGRPGGSESRHRLLDQVAKDRLS